MSDPKRAHAPLLLLGLALLGMALAYEFLWMARHPTGGDMAFEVNRLGIRAVLRGATSEAFAFASLLVATAGVVAAYLAARRAVGSAAGAHCGPGATAWRIVLAAAVAVLFAVPWHYVLSWVYDGLYEHAVYDAAWSRKQFLKEAGLACVARLHWLGASVALGGFLLATRWRWPSAGLGGLVDWLRALPSWVVVGAGCLVVVGLASAYAALVLKGMPRHPDGGVYMFQAKSFAQGRLTSPLLGGRDFFDPSHCPAPAGTPFAFVGDRFFCVGLPVTAACYAVGVLVGVPWLVAAVLGGAVVMATYFLAREAFGPAAGLLAAVLAAASPWLILMSGEPLTHVPGAVPSVVFLAAVLRAMDRGSWRAAALAGLCLGLAANTRPVTAVGLCVPAAAAWAVWLIRRPRDSWRPTLAFAVALAVPMAGLMAYNAATTGHPLKLGYQVAMTGWVSQVPESMRTPGWRWTLPLGFANVAKLLHTLGRGTYRWPIPWLGVALAALLLAGRSGAARIRRAPLLLALTLLSTCLAYARWRHVVIAQGGPRYVFEVMPVAIVLAAGGVVALHSRLVAAGIDARRIAAVILAALAFCVAYGLKAPLTTDLDYFVKDARAVQRMFGAIERQAERPALVFLPMGPSGKDTARFYLALGRNDPALRGPLLYARDLGQKNALLAADLPGRHYYRWDGQQRSLLALSGDGTLLLSAEDPR